MNPFKLIGWAAVLLCVVSAFTTFEYLPLLLLLLGIAAGFGMAPEDHVRVLVSALVLFSLSGVLNHVPEVGDELVKIFSAAATFASGAALTIVSRNIWKRYKP
ncbi:MAG: hypothetical protein ACT4UQ_02870 [Gammaproteobacteria bacterium]